MKKYVKLCTLLSIMITLVFQSAISETERQTFGLVDFYIQECSYNYDTLSNIIVIPDGYQIENVLDAFSMGSDEIENLSIYSDGFVYETELGLAISDSLYMVDHENLDELHSFDLSFMPIEGACEYVISCFSKLGIQVAIEAAYTIDASEYERLYNSHKEWITSMGRTKLEWIDDEICYVIYLNQEYEGTSVYPGFFWYEELTNNYPGTEIVVFLSSEGFEYISCGWTTAMVNIAPLNSIIVYETAMDAFAKAYNDLLTLTPKRISVYDMDLMYMTFDDNGNYILRPFWVFSTNTEDGERRDYALDAVNGEVFGL